MPLLNYMILAVSVLFAFQAKSLDLPTVSEVDGKSFTLKTGSILSNISTYSAERIEIESDVVDQIRVLPLVSYTTDAELLGEIPFIGRPNHTYEIQYRIENNYLRVEKVAPARDLPFHEMIFAKKLSDGRFAVPMVAYRVDYYNVEKIENVFIEISAPIPSATSYVRINRLNRYAFDLNSDKDDIFPVSYFFGSGGRSSDSGQWSGDWYYSTSAVDALNGGQFNEVDQGDISERVATKIKFIKDKDQLLAVNMRTDERLKGLSLDDRLNYQLILSIPVQWPGYAIYDTQVVDNLGLKWSERSYVQIDFERIRDLNEALPISLGSAKKLTDLRFSKDHFSFTLFYIDSGVKIRHSFIKAN